MIKRYCDRCKMEIQKTETHFNNVEIRAYDYCTVTYGLIGNCHLLCFHCWRRLSAVYNEFMTDYKES